MKSKCVYVFIGTIQIQPNQFEIIIRPGGGGGLSSQLVYLLRSNSLHTIYLVLLFVVLCCITYLSIVLFFVILSCYIVIFP